MPSPWRWLQPFILVGALVGACSKAEPVPPGDIAATLAIDTVDDTQFDPILLRGKPTLVVFASPTCPHCIAELPLAQRAATTEQANVVAVFVAGDKERAANVATNTKFGGHVLVDDGALRKRYGIESVPYTLVLGSDGHAHRAFRGEQSEATLRAALADAK